MSKLFAAVEINEEDNVIFNLFSEKDKAEEYVMIRNNEVIENEYGGNENDWLNDENPNSNTWIVMSEEEFVEYCEDIDNSELLEFAAKNIHHWNNNFTHLRSCFSDSVNLIWTTGYWTKKNSAYWEMIDCDDQETTGLDICYIDSNISRAQCISKEQWKAARIEVLNKEIKQHLDNYTFQISML